MFIKANQIVLNSVIVPTGWFYTTLVKMIHLDYLWMKDLILSTFSSAVLTLSKEKYWYAVDGTIEWLLRAESHVCT